MTILGRGRIAVLTGSVGLLAMAACSRSDAPSEGSSPVNLGVTTNAQTGVTRTPQGIELNSISAASNCLSPSDMRRPPSDFSPEQRREIVGCMNAGLAAQVNPQLPRQIDALTRLDRVDADGPTLTYNYTVLRARSTLPANAVQQIETGTRRMVCSQAPMRQTLQMGGAYAYRWVDNQGAQIHAMRIDAC